jgi:hypothetical protein
VTSLLDQIRFRPTTMSVTGVQVVQLLPGERRLLLDVVDAAKEGCLAWEREVQRIAPGTFPWSEQNASPASRALRTAVAELDGPVAQETDAGAPPASDVDPDVVDAYRRGWEDAMSQENVPEAPTSIRAKFLDGET